MLPGALASALFVVSLFVAPPYLARAWHAWRQIRGLQGDGNAGLVASWTVDAPAWLRFQTDLQEARGKDDDCRLSKMALSLCALDAPSTGITVRIGQDAVLVGPQFVSLRGNGASILGEVTQADFGGADSVPGTEYLAFISTYQGHSRGLGSYEVEEIGLLVPVPRIARAAMQRAADHFTPEAISAIHARVRRQARAGCLLNLMLLVGSLATMATAATFDLPHVGWYGLMLFGAWAVWLAYHLMQMLIALIGGFGDMVGLLRRAYR